MDNRDNSNLIEAAQRAREHAYAPYSKYKVGAALLTKNGEVFTGCNVENASYGLSMCAERVALYKAVCAGATDFAAIAVVTESDEPASPCGACRQVLAEFSSELNIIMANLTGGCREASIAELLPLAFTKSKLAEGKVNE